MSRDVSRGIPFIGIKMIRAADVEERPTIGEAYVKDNLFFYFFAINFCLSQAHHETNYSSNTQRKFSIFRVPNTNN